MGNHLFVIFAVLDVSLAINWCINCSFFTFIICKVDAEGPKFGPCKICTHYILKFKFGMQRSTSMPILVPIFSAGAYCNIWCTRDSVSFFDSP